MPDLQLLARQCPSLFSCRHLPLSDITGLGSQLIRNKYLICVKDIIIIGITNFANRLTNHIFIIKFRSSGNLSGNGYTIAFDKSLTGNPAVWILLQACIKTLSEMESETLSGWPSPTDSEEKINDFDIPTSIKTTRKCKFIHQRIMMR